MERSLIYLLVSLLIGSDAFAQLDESDTVQWQANTNLSLRLNSGNVERLILIPEVNVSHLGKSRLWGFSFRERYTYGTFGSFRTENDLLSRNFIYLHPTRKWYPYIMAWFQTHARQQLDLRYQVGPGLTYVPLRKGREALKVSLTASYEENRYTVPGLTEVNDPAADRYSVVRATVRLFGTHALGKSGSSLYYECLFQQAIDNAQDWRMFGECGINLSITPTVSTRTYVNYEYQKVHVVNVKPGDLILNMGLNCKLLHR